MRTHEHLLTNLLLGTAPLLVWAAHFVFSYVFVAVSCAAGPVRTAALLMASVIAIVATAVLLWRSVQRLRRRHGPQRLRDVATAGSAVLALLAIVWTSVPMLLISGCG